MPWIENVAAADIPTGFHHDVGPNSMLISITDPTGWRPEAKQQFKERHDFEFLDAEDDDREPEEAKITDAQAEQIVGTEAYSKLSAQQMQTALGQAAQLRQTQSRLTGIEGEVYNEGEALKAVIEGSPEAILASQQRAQREGARFGGASGVTGSSLRSTTMI
jgi:hypothetical protein